MAVVAGRVVFSLARLNDPRRPTTIAFHCAQSSSALICPADLHMRFGLACADAPLTAMTA